MVIDFHAHTFPDKIAPAAVRKLGEMSHTRSFADGTVAGLSASMEANGIDWSLVLPVATHERQVVHVNDASARINEEWWDKGILSFGAMHPDFADWKNELSRVAQLGMKGVKIHPIYQNVDLDDIRYLRMLDRCGELGLMVLTHAGRDIGYPDRDNCTPRMTLNALRQVGPVQLILAHMGGWRHWDEVEELLVDTSVCLDTSYCLGRMVTTADGYYTEDVMNLMRHEQFIRMVRSFGKERILYGSDSPWFSQNKGRDRILEVPLTPEEHAAILGGNAQRLLNLPERKH